MAQTNTGRYRFWEPERGVPVTAEQKRLRARVYQARYDKKRAAKGLPPSSSVVYQRRREAGQCPRCGQAPRAHYVSCAKCAAQYSRAQGLKPKRPHRESCTFPFALQVRVTPRMRDKLVQTAEFEGQAVSAIVRLILDTYFAEINEGVA